MTDGWGLTGDGELVIGSDGTSKLYFIDPVSFVGPLVKSCSDEKCCERRVVLNVPCCFQIAVGLGLFE